MWAGSTVGALIQAARHDKPRGWRRLRGGDQQRLTPPGWWLATWIAGGKPGRTELTGRLGYWRTSSATRTIAVMIPDGPTCSGARQPAFTRPVLAAAARRWSPNSAGLRELRHRCTSAWMAKPVPGPDSPGPPGVTWSACIAGRGQAGARALFCAAPPGGAPHTFPGIDMGDYALHLQRPQRQTSTTSDVELG